LKRANLSVDSDVFEKFSRASKSQNKTIQGFANEALELASTVCLSGGSISDLKRLWSAYQLIKNIDVITLPSDFVDEINEKLVNTDEKWTMDAYYRLGSNVGSLLRLMTESIETLSSIAADFFILLPVKHFRMNTTDREGTIQVDIVGAGRNLESAKCTLEFLTGVLDSFGFEITRSDLNVGTIRAWANRAKRADYRED
jgi:hypothetical protein